MGTSTRTDILPLPYVLRNRINNYIFINDIIKTLSNLFKHVIDITIFFIFLVKGFPAYCRVNSVYKCSSQLLIHSTERNSPVFNVTKLPTTCEKQALLWRLLQYHYERMQKITRNEKL